METASNKPDKMNVAAGFQRDEEANARIAQGHAQNLQAKVPES